MAAQIERMANACTARGLPSKPAAMSASLIPAKQQEFAIAFDLHQSTSTRSKKAFIAKETSVVVAPLPALTTPGSAAVVQLPARTAPEAAAVVQLPALTAPAVSNI